MTARGGPPVTRTGGETLHPPRGGKDIDRAWGGHGPFRLPRIGRFRLYYLVGARVRCRSCRGSLRHDAGAVRRHTEREMVRHGGLSGLERRLESLARYRRNLRTLRRLKYYHAKRQEAYEDGWGGTR